MDPNKVHSEHNVRVSVECESRFKRLVVDIDAAPVTTFLHLAAPASPLDLLLIILLANRVCTWDD